MVSEAAAGGEAEAAEALSPRAAHAVRSADSVRAADAAAWRSILSSSACPVWLRQGREKALSEEGGGGLWVGCATRRSLVWLSETVHVHRPAQTAAFTERAPCQERHERQTKDARQAVQSSKELGPGCAALRN